MSGVTALMGEALNQELSEAKFITPLSLFIERLKQVLCFVLYQC